MHNEWKRFQSEFVSKNYNEDSVFVSWLSLYRSPTPGLEERFDPLASLSVQRPSNSQPSFKRLNTL